MLYGCAMSTGRAALGALIARFAGRLRYPQLFFLMAAVFLLDVLIPDMLPFADEILLGLATVLLGALRNRTEDEPEERVEKAVN